MDAKQFLHCVPMGSLCSRPGTHSGSHQVLGGGSASSSNVQNYQSTANGARAAAAEAAERRLKSVSTSMRFALLETIHQVCLSTLGTSTRNSGVESEAGSSRSPTRSIEVGQTCAYIEARRTTCGECKPDLTTPLPLFIDFIAVGLKFEWNLCRFKPQL